MNKSFFLVIILFLAIVVQLSCNNSPKNETKKQSTQKTMVYKPGTFVYKINCRTNQTQTYAAYFPVSYQPNTEFPVIIVFDAHARGKMAVHKFQKAADEFGYIMVVSNNAKNGLKTINNTLNALFDDVFFRFKIDKRRVYTAGFSGGARIASSVAIYKGGIEGVLAIAGGLPKTGQEITQIFNYAAIVGETDFNYLELKALNKQMNKIGFPHSLTISKNGHEWPNKKRLSASIEWFEIMGMKKGIVPVNDNLIRNYTENMADSVNNLLLKGKVYRAKQLYEQFLSTIDGLFDISTYQKSYEVLLKNPNIKIQKAEIEASDKIETDKQQYYINLFKQQSFSKLLNEVNRLKSDTRAKNKLKSNRAKRLLNYISMLSYIFTDGAIKSTDLQLTEKYLNLYKKVDNNNPDRYFFEACISATKNNEKETLNNLQKAVKFGFFDVNRLQSENYFSNIRKRTEFKDIIAKANENFEGF